VDLVVEQAIRDYPHDLKRQSEAIREGVIEAWPS